MTVSIQMPNWRVVQTIRERLGAVTARLAHSERPPGSGDAAVTNEWSSVMTGQASAGAPAAAGPAAAAPSTATTSRRAERVRPVRRRLEISSAWLLPATLLVVCLVALGWLFSSGTAAAIWLVALIGVALAGVPLALLVLRLLGYEDPD